MTVIKEEIVDQGDEKVVEVRSEGGKLLFKKTKKGYEMKCPRTKQVCLVPYEMMLVDCLKCLADGMNERELLQKADQIRQLLKT